MQAPDSRGDQDGGGTAVGGEHGVGTAGFNERLNEARDAIGLIIAHDSEGHYGSYSKLSTVLEAVDPALRAVGLMRRDQIIDGELVVEIFEPFDGIFTAEGTRVEGQRIVASFPLPFGQPPEKVGASISYFRRYGLGILIGFATDSDVDDPKYQKRQEEGPTPIRPDPTPSARRRSTANRYDDELLETQSEGAVNRARKALKIADGKPMTGRRMKAITDWIVANPDVAKAEEPKAEEPKAE